MRKENKVCGYVSAKEGAFLLAGEGRTPVVLVEENDYPGVKRAAGDLCEDLELVTGIPVSKEERAMGQDTEQELAELSDNTACVKIVAGTLGRNRMIDFLVEQGRIDVSQIQGKWEVFQIQIAEDMLVIVGSDQRGTIYGIYDLCEKIGVSPWKWWADVRPAHAEKLYLNLEQPYVEGESSVKYRGIFINDEYAFDQWALHRGDTDFVELYKKVFELLLRLKANTLWPAMHDGSPYFHKNFQNTLNAAEYGIVIGTSHCEMLLRNNVSEYFDFERKWEQEHPNKELYKKKLTDSPIPCAYVYTERNPETGAFVHNKDLLADYWRESIARYGVYECIFTMGMRGLHDATWQPAGADTVAEKRKLLEEIIGLQRQLLEEVLQKPAEEIPQLFIPYKEIQEIYDAGMEIPEDMMLMWTDDNYGYIRQLPTEENADRRGGAGIYYHVGYHGSPNSYIWLSTAPYGLIREEMCKAYDCSAGKIWIVNVGDLKPAEGRIEYFMNLARDVEGMRKGDLKGQIAAKAARDFGFGEDKAEEYAAIELEFQRLVYARKPEHFQPGLFNYQGYSDEGQEYLDSYSRLVKRSEALYEELQEEDKAAFYQLQLYPLRSCFHVAAKYIYADKACLCQEQGRGSVVNQYGHLSDQAYFELLKDTKAYNSLCDGKWNLIMDPYQPYFRSRRAILTSILQKPVCGELGYSTFAVWTPEAMTCYRATGNTGFILLYNQGSGYIDWEMTADKDWVLPERSCGTVFQEERVEITVDWSRVTEEQEKAVVILRGMEEDKKWKSFTFEVTADNRIPAEEGVFMEENGYVSIEAVHFTEKTEKGTAEWRREAYLGRTGNALKLYPDRMAAVEEPDSRNAATVSYQVWFDSEGEFRTDVYRVPTLNERGRIRFAIGIDEEKPVILEGTRAYVNDSDGTDSWGKGVYENTEVLTAKLAVKKPGLHTIRLCQVDAGVIVEKIVVYTREAKPSYFGPKESRIREEQNF